MLQTSLFAVLALTWFAKEIWVVETVDAVYTAGDVDLTDKAGISESKSNLRMVSVRRTVRGLHRL